VTKQMVRAKLKEQRGERAERFIRSFENSRSELFKLTDAGVRNVNQIINQIRDEIRSQLRAASPFDPRAPFTTRLLPVLIETVNNSLDELRRRAGDELDEKLPDAFGIGATTTANALRSANIPISFPAVTPELVVIAATISGTLLDEIISNLGESIVNQINLSVLNLVPASRTLNNIDRLLRTSVEVRRGLRRRVGFAFQTEAIYRTEIGRVYSSAQQAASEQIEQTVTTLRKSWLTSPRTTRRGHRDAENRYRDGGSTGPIPVRQRFEVTDFTRTGRTEFLTLGGNIRPRFGAVIGQRVVKVSKYTRRGRLITDRMLHPRDASASAGNVIQCTCVSLDVVPEFEEAADKALGRIS